MNKKILVMLLITCIVVFALGYWWFDRQLLQVPNEYRLLSEAILVAPNDATIVIDSGNYKGNFVIQKEQRVTIIGNSRVTIQPLALNKSIFTVSDGAKLTLSNLSIVQGSADMGGAILTNGELIVDNVVFDDNTAQIYGGAIYIGHPLQPVQIKNSHFINNHAADGGAITCSWNSNGRVQVKVDNVKFSDNSAVNHGGAIYSWDCVFNVIQAEFNNNRAVLGGAFAADDYHEYAYSPETTIVKSKFQGNIAENLGGALYHRRGLLTIEQSVFDDNLSNGSGGALYMHQSTSTLKQDEFVNNKALIDGGAIHSYDEDSLSIYNSDFTNNQASETGAAFHVTSAAMFKCDNCHLLPTVGNVVAFYNTVVYWLHSGSLAKHDGSAVLFQTEIFYEASVLP